MISSEKEIDFSHVTSTFDEDDSSTAHIFQCNLNDAKTRNKLYEGALSEPFEKEVKTNASKEWTQTFYCW